MIAAAKRRPEAVKSLVLIEPALLKMAAGRPAVRKVLLRMAAAIILPYSAANKARKIMKLLGIPDEFALTDADLASLGSSLKDAKLPSKSSMIASLKTIREADIPLLVISGGSNAAFIETGDMAVEIGGGKHLICPAPHHFPQWNDKVFNPMVAEFWTSVEAHTPAAATA
jgi:pimeloyl-ACP methyl ester carboxylesterase